MNEWLSNNLGFLLSLVMAFTGLIAWAIRIEGKVRENANDIQDLKKYIETTTPVLNKIANDVEVIKNDMTWLKKEHQSTQMEYQKIITKLSPS